MIKKQPLHSTIILGIIFLFLERYFNNGVFLLLSIGLFFSSLLFEVVVNSIDKLVNALTSLLNLIVPKILLTLVFYLIILPISLLNKMLIRNQRFNRSPNSQFINSDKYFSKEDFNNPW